MNRRIRSASTSDATIFPSTRCSIGRWIRAKKIFRPDVVSKLNNYMRLGGTILFDTRDLTLGAVRGENSPGEQTLRRLTQGLDLPPLEPVPPDHVLTKAFYILKEFPGRWSGGQVWVEDIAARRKGNGTRPRARRRWRFARDHRRQ